MIWQAVALIFLALFLYAMVTSFLSLGRSIKGDYEETMAQVSRDAKTTEPPR